LPPEFPPPSAASPEPTRPRRRVWRCLRRGLLWTFLVLLLLALVPPGAVLALRWKNPSTTAFMLQSPTQPVQYRWVPAAQIPETLRLAAIAAEDQKFRTHWGFDFIAIAEALEHNEKSTKKRGASTITQQTAKNLFLWPSRSWVRKGLEVTFTLLLEGLWSKDRILEVYLNVAEFGPGIYGAGAAAQAFFHKPAAEMTPAESALLAAVLPNPRKWRADHPGPYLESRVDWILAQIGQPPRYATVPEFEPEAPASGEDAEPAPVQTAPPETAPPEGAPPQEGTEPAEQPLPEEAPAEGTPPAEPGPKPNQAP
jgi:monofunctional biosynthetic peptidoglycan transglycosylase